jgi:tRNA(fMet)-specific endonuclease VapC
VQYLVDTDWALNALGGRRGAGPALASLTRDGIGISRVSVAEIYDGAFATADPVAHLAMLRTFLVAFTPIDLDDQTAERFGELRFGLRRRGLLIPDFDLLIAATALRHGLTLLTFNVRHFARIPDLRLYDPPDQSV